MIRKQHNGPVIGIKASYLPAELMTPEHPVLAVRGHPGSGKSRSRRRQKTFRDGDSPAWIRADELRIGDYVFFPKYRQHSTQKYALFEHIRLAIDERFASILGWYCAEGSSADSVSRNMGFSLSSPERDHISEIRELLGSLFGAKTSVYTNKRGTSASVVVTSSDYRELVRAFKSWCGSGAANKKIPEFIINSNPRILKEFLVSLFKGDGWSPYETGKLHRYNDKIDLTTSSKVMAYQLLLALSKIEIPAEMVNHPGSVNSAYSVRVRGTKVRNLIQDFPVFEKINKFHYWEVPEGFYYPIRKIWTENYSGDVYDFQAPGLTMLSPFVTQDCVTKWSIENVEWEGVPIAGLAERAGVSPEAKWVMFHCVDGYTAPIPVEDALNEDAIVAFKINGKPLSREQGFPARPFMPHLYGWKSAKWLNRIEFMRDYRDGYWEMYGYHERGNIWEEERFKGHVGKHSKRTAVGTA